MFGRSFSVGNRSKCSKRNTGNARREIGKIRKENESLKILLEKKKNNGRMEEIN